MTELEEMINDDLIITDLDVKDKTDMIDTLTNIFYENGYVKDTYKEALINREKIFPTGLDTGVIKVCIPHTDCQYTIKPGILIATLKNSIKYQRMDNPQEEIDVNLVFMLSINNPANQASTLGRLMSLFSKGDILQAIKNGKTSQEIKALIFENT